MLVCEYYRGLPIAGSQLALRLDASWRLREVVGKSMRPGVALGMVSVLGAEIWWPTQDGLVGAQLRDDPIELVHGHPEQFRRAFRVLDGVELAAWSILDEADLPILGWRENPVITPEGEIFTVEVHDAAIGEFGQAPPGGAPTTEDSAEPDGGSNDCGEDQQGGEIHRRSLRP